MKKTPVTVLLTACVLLGASSAFAWEPGPGVFVRSPSLAVDGARLALRVLEVDPKNPPDGWAPEDEAVTPPLSFDVYSGEVMEAFPGQLDWTLGSLSSSEDPARRELSELLSAVMSKDPKDRRGLLVELLYRQGSAPLGEIVAQLDPERSSELTVPLSALSDALYDREMFGYLGDRFVITMYPGFGFPDIPSPPSLLSMLDTFPLEWDPPLFRHVETPIALLNDPCLAQLPGNTVTGFSSSYSYQPPFVTGISFDFDASATEALTLRKRIISDKSYDHVTFVQSQSQGGMQSEYVDVAMVPNTTYVLCASGQRWDPYANRYWPVSASFFQLTSQGKIAPSTAQITAIARELPRNNPATGGDYVTPTVEVTIAADPVLDAVVTRIDVYRDGFRVGTISPSGLSRWQINAYGNGLSAGLIPCSAGGVGAAGSGICVAQDMAGQHARAVRYFVRRFYDTAYSTASSVDSAEAQTVLPFAWGWADAHTHMFNHVSFGAVETPRKHGVDFDFGMATWNRKRFGWLHGTVEGTEPAALTSCGETHGNVYTRDLTSASPPLFDEDYAEPSCILPNATGCRVRSDAVQRHMGDKNSHADIELHRVDGYAGGYPDWPRAQLFTHQQMWNGWLKRAHKYGLRLATMLAESNSSMCRLLLKGADANCKDGSNAVLSLDAAKAFEQAIDATGTTSQSRNSDWMRIVYTPEEARRAIAQGKLAIVLGVEMEDVLGSVGANDPAGTNGGYCMLDPSRPCPHNTDAAVRSRIRFWYDQGVRHIFPVHLADSAVGGTSFYESSFVALGWEQNGHLWSGPAYAAGADLNASPPSLATYTNGSGGPQVPSNNCGTTPAHAFDLFGAPITPDPLMQPRRFLLDPQNGALNTNAWHTANFLISETTGALFANRPNYYIGSFTNTATTNAHCNGLGLTAIGRSAVTAIMDYGMVLDVDHFSAVARRQIFDMANARAYPLVASHAIFHENFAGSPQEGGEDSERALDNFDLRGLLRWRGLVAPRLTQAGVASGTLPGNYTACTVPTARTFAFAYDIIAQKKQSANATGQDNDPLFSGGLAIGSDFNGFIDMPQARGSTPSTACGGAPFDYGTAYLRKPYYSTSTVGVVSSTPPANAANATLTKWRSANGTEFDYNVRGVATVGQIPELMADLANVGGLYRGQGAIDMAYRGVEAYTRMWEQAEWSSKSVASGADWKMSSTTSMGDALAKGTDDSAWAAPAVLGSYGQTPLLPPDSSDVFSTSGLSDKTKGLWVASSTDCKTSCPAGTVYFRKKFETKGSWDSVGAKRFRFKGIDANDIITVYVDGVFVGNNVTPQGMGNTLGVALDATRLSSATRGEGEHMLTVVLTNQQASSPSALFFELF